MANDRIYLKCNRCGETLFLGKSFYSAFYFERYDGVPLDKKLNEFFDKHFLCLEDEKFSGGRWWGDFSVEYEETDLQELVVEEGKE